MLKRNPQHDGDAYISDPMVAALATLYNCGLWQRKTLRAYSFIHSGHLYSAPSSPLLLRGAPDYSMDTVSEFHAKRAQTTAGKGLAQGHYVAAVAEFEPTTLRLKVIVSTKAPPRQTWKRHMKLTVRTHVKIRANLNSQNSKCCHSFGAKDYWVG